VLIEQKILERAQKKCAETPPFPICATQSTLRHQMDEETLNKILRIRGGIAPMPQEGVKRRPV
jgi:hypothetical protein